MLVLCNHFHFQHFSLRKRFQMICLEKKIKVQIKYMSATTKSKFRLYYNELHIKFQHALFSLLRFVLK